MSEEKDSSIHDRFFKEIMSDINLAKDWLEFFLPMEIKSLLELNTLTFNKDSFITDSLREVLSDMVFSCHFRKGDEHGPVFITLILEHKSRLGRIPHAQLLNYLAGAYHIQSKQKGKLQPVIPIVFYHGNKRAHIKKKMESHFADLPADTVKYIPLFEFLLIDMSEFPDEKLWSIGNAFLRASMISMKYFKDPKWLMEHIASIYNSVFPIADRNLYYRFTVYFYRILKVPPKVFNLLIQNLPEDMKVQEKSLYDYIIEEGIEKGIEKGKQESKKQLYNEAVPNLLKLGLSYEQIAEALNLDRNELKQYLGE